MQKDNSILPHSENPVLNKPYEETKYYYNTDMNSNIRYMTIINGCFLNCYILESYPRIHLPYFLI